MDIALMLRRLRLPFALGLLLTAGTAALAQDAEAPTTADLSYALDTVWVLLTAFLVFWMQAGFALVESGFVRAKNTVNILMKNTVDFAAATLTYWLVGFGMMFGGGASVAIVGWAGFGVALSDASLYPGLEWANVPVAAKFIFQLVFAGTTATIISGAAAERTKFSAYVLYSVLVSALIYPISGHWIWGGGWLQNLGFLDFAGSSAVHSMGGWLALVMAFILGPRLGKYTKEGKVHPIPGHSMPLATLGTFILWLGWFGFNPGSTMAADAGAIAHIAVTTNAAAAAGFLAAMFMSWIVLGKPDAGLSMNGTLAGLVAVTAGCAFVTPGAALLIGAIGGLLMFAAVLFFDRIHLDDPVGAVSVHGVCGAFGTLAVGLWAVSDLTGGAAGLFYGGGLHLLGVQALGVASIFGWAILAGFIVFGLINKTVGLRVTPAEEVEGLDVLEHGAEAYPYFARW